MAGVGGGLSRCSSEETSHGISKWQAQKTKTSSFLFFQVVMIWRGLHSRGTGQVNEGEVPHRPLVTNRPL